MEDFGIWEKLIFEHFAFSPAFRKGFFDRKEIFTFHSHTSRTMNSHISTCAYGSHGNTMGRFGRSKCFFGKIETTSQWEWWWWWWFICPFFRSFIKMNTLSSISDDLHLLLQLPLLVEPIALDMRSWMNRGWTQFGDAVLLSRMEPLEAESISQRRRSRCHELSRFGYSDYRWIIGENGCLLQDLNQDELV